VDAVLDDAGNFLKLGAIVGRGGEGVVRELAFDPAAVAKLYHRPLDGKKAEKLRAMVQSSIPEIVRFAAWPISTLYKNDQIVGFLMRRMGRSDKPIHELYTPKTRLKEFPTADWLFLIHVAANIARGFAAIHRAGHVIGDVNHGNVLVSSNGTTSFIDCDSFQVTESGRVYPCEVAVSNYTPPELQKRQSFGSVVRTQNHDAFGLAVLIFHLLFMGRHPLAGRFSGKGEMPIERAIAESRFAFGRLARNAQMSPPPDSLTLNQIPASLGDAFERAFDANAAGGSRPAALEWLMHLEKAKAELGRCRIHRSHLFFSKLAACPWCEIESHGIILFIEVAADLTPDRNIEESWRRLDSLPPLGDLPPLPSLYSEKLNAKPISSYQNRGRKRRIQVGIGVGAVAVVAVVTAIANLSSGESILLIVAAMVFALLLPRKLQREKAAVARMKSDCETKYSALESKYKSECAGQTFVIRLDECRRLKIEYEGLPLQRQRRLQELERNKYQLQLYAFLDGFSINRAKIPGIGPGRKQMLASYGVDSAADATPAKIAQVPTIGPKLAGQIMNWRISLEGRFRFNPNKAIDKLEIEKVDRELRARRIQLEGLIKTAVADALAIHSLVLARRKAYAEQALASLKDLVQAQANYNAS
jgi:DNA-binding helix-hairpin-helix protein with protein kinase domain